VNTIRNLSAVFLAASLLAGAVRADPPAPPAVCSRHLAVELTPDVPNPRDLTFLSSLVTMPGYQLVWRGQDGTLIEVDLSGPGPEDQCRAVIAALRKDSRVLSVNVEHD
jgi:hypothetical protein